MVTLNSPYTTITIFTFPDSGRLWPFTQMGFSRSELADIPNLRFWKLLGTGRGIGFSKNPDWNRYGLLAVWERMEDAVNFLSDSPFIGRYRRRSLRDTTLVLKTMSAHGAWNGTNPFLPTTDHSSTDEAICVLTRATIRYRRLRRFWSMVEPVANELSRAPGLLGSIGVGEAPFIRQATISLWENDEAMRNFAYNVDGIHKEVVHRTRSEGWYSEELFARFTVVEQLGDFP